MDMADHEIDFTEYFPLNPSMVEELERLFKRSTSYHQLVDNSNVFQLGVNLAVAEDDESFGRVMAEFKENGVDKEYCPDFLLPERKVKSIPKKPAPAECVFCRNNGEEQEFYRRHVLKDKDGKVLCPVLRAYTCPMCGAHGDYAHTIKYCPKSTKYEINSTVLALKTARTAAGKRKQSLKN